MKNKLRIARGIVLLLSGLLLVNEAAAQDVQRPVGDDQWYYRLGGGGSFVAYRQSKRTNVDFGVGADWRMFRGCEFDPQISIAETFADAQNSIYAIADNLVDSARGLITAWGLAKVQEEYPALYDFVMNGAKEATQKFQLAMKSCRDYQSDLNNGRDPASGWLSYGTSASWAHASNNGENPVAVDQTISRQAADEGITWINGEKRGGETSAPINIIQDSTEAGYVHLTEETGGGSVGDNELGIGLDNPTMVFQSAEEAQIWMREVLGERTISTCKDCDKFEVKVGQGLRLKLVEEQENSDELLRDVLATLNPTSDQLNELSVPSLGLVVTDKMIRQLRNLETYEANIFASKLASEIAVMRVMEKALTARDILKVGMQEPNVAANDLAVAELQDAKSRLDAEINDMLFEGEIRKKVFSHTAMTLGNISQARELSQELEQVKQLPQKPANMKAGAIRRD